MPRPLVLRRAARRQIKKLSMSRSQQLPALLVDPPVLDRRNQPAGVVLGRLLAPTSADHQIAQVLLDLRFAFHRQTDQGCPERQAVAEVLSDEPDLRNIIEHG
jgi:hypothetical protein